MNVEGGGLKNDDGRTASSGRIALVVAMALVLAMGWQFMRSKEREGTTKAPLLSKVEGSLAISTYDVPSAGGLLLTKQLTGYYPMNGDARDHGPGGHHGRIHNAGWGTDRLGVTNRALRLTGRTLARLVVPLFPVDSPGLSVAFWLHPFDVGITRSVISHDLEGDVKFQITLSGGQLIGRFSADGGEYEVILPDIIPHRWQHIVFTFKPGAKGEVTAYLDARHLVRAPATGRLTASRYNLTLGGIHPGMPGLMDNLRLYNRPLTAAEAGAIYTAEGGNRDGARPVAWDFHYAQRSPLDTHAIDFLRYTNHVRRIVEIWRNSSIAYWAPTEPGKVGSLHYQFQFGTNRARRIYLGSHNQSWDSNGSAKVQGRGAIALAASRDGTNWVSLQNQLRPLRWGGPAFYHDDLPPALLGGTSLWLHVEMLATNIPPDANYSPVHHAESLVGIGTNFPTLELKAQW